MYWVYKDEYVLKVIEHNSYCMQGGHKCPTGRLCQLGLTTEGQQPARVPRSLLINTALLGGWYRQGRDPGLGSLSISLLGALGSSS